MTFKVREVDAFEFAEELEELHADCFEGDAPMPDFLNGHWFLTYCGDRPGAIGFAGMIASDRYNDTGYYTRVGVLPMFRGAGLQRLMTRAIHNCARKNGWGLIVSDTTDNVPSANNFIRAGYHLFGPSDPWAFAHSLYWRKYL